MDSSHKGESDTMTTLTLDHKYIELLQPFGNLHEVLAEAIKRYALELINERIDLARQNEVQLWS